MRQKKVDAYLPSAYDVLDAWRKNNKGKLPKGTRGLVSSFGAALTMGSFQSALAFYEGTSGKDVLIGWLKETYNKNAERKIPSNQALTEYYMQSADKRAFEDEIWAAAVAIKLASKLFQCEGEDQSTTKKSSSETSEVSGGEAT